MGIVWLIIFGCYALGFWYGGKLTRDEPENYSIGKMLVVSFHSLTFSACGMICTCVCVWMHACICICVYGHVQEKSKSVKETETKKVWNMIALAFTYPCLRIYGCSAQCLVDGCCISFCSTFCNILMLFFLGVLQRSYWCILSGKC